MRRKLALTLFLLLSVAMPVIAKEALVLLPIQGEQLDSESKAVLRAALRHSLSQRYHVVSGAVVDAKLRDLVRTACEVADCLRTLAQAFNRDLLGRALVVAKEDDYLITIEIKNVFTDEIVESMTQGCPNCSISDAVLSLRNMADVGNVNRIDTIDYRSVAANIDRRELPNQGESDFAMLVLDSTPSGITVEIDGVMLGQTPLQYFDVSIGQSVALVLSKAGYVSETVTFIVQPGANELLSLSLEQAMGSVIVTTQPYERGANIYLGQGEQSLGRVPAQLQLPEGEYSLWVEGVEAQGQLNVQVLAGQRHHIVVTLNSANVLSNIQSEPGSVFRDVLALGGQGPEMVVMPKGAFQMGDFHGAGDGNELPLREITFVQRFAMASTEVTKAQFRQFVDATGYLTDAEKNAEGLQGCYVHLGELVFDWQTGSDWREPGFKQGENEPVVCVSWNDANEYAYWLSQQTNQHYRLPTEAEWEYAARAGSKALYGFGADDRELCLHANLADQTVIKNHPDWYVADCDDGQLYTAAVATYRSNSFGLYDMHGNVWEWTQDCWHKTYAGGPTDGSVWLTGACDKRVVRGGAWTDSAEHQRAANRIRNAVADRYLNNGFRLARDL